MYRFYRGSGASYEDRADADLIRGSCIVRALSVAYILTSSRKPSPGTSGLPRSRLRVGGARRGAAVCAFHFLTVPLVIGVPLSFAVAVNRAPDRLPGRAASPRLGHLSETSASTMGAATAGLGGFTAGLLEPGSTLQYQNYTP